MNKKALKEALKDIGLDLLIVFGVIIFGMIITNLFAK